MKGKIYAVGLGPGDPELITVKALNIMKKADIIICPTSDAKNKGIAYKIVSNYFSDNKICELLFPMHHNVDDLKNHWEENALFLVEKLNKGLNIAFGVLGDVMLYSSYSYLDKYLLEYGYETEFVSGIHSYSALASAHKIPLSQWDKTLCIVPIKRDESRLEEIVKVCDNVVIMKASHNHKEIKKIVDKQKNLKIYGASYVSQNKEALFTEIDKDKLPYMTTILLKKEN